MKRYLYFFVVMLLFALQMPVRASADNHGPGSAEVQGVRPAAGDTLSAYQEEALTAMGLRVVDDTEAGFRYIGFVPYPIISNPYGGGSRFNEQNAATGFTYRFSGSYIAIVMCTCFNSPKINIKIDGVQYEQVDLYAPTYTEQQIVFAADGLPEGPHMLEVSCAAEDSDVPGYPFIEFDALITRIDSGNAYTIIDDTDPAIRYTNLSARNHPDTAQSYNQTTHCNENVMPCSIEYTFYGSYIGVLMSECHASADADMEIFLDGQPVETISLYKANQYLPKNVVFEASTLSETQHTILVRSKTVPAEAAACPDAFVEFDGFIISSAKAPETRPTVPETGELQNVQTLIWVICLLCFAGLLCLRNARRTCSM